MVDKEQAVRVFADACREKGLSVTHQRIAVYEAILDSRAHPGAEEIFGEVRKRIPTISRGTVYRTLETLARLGLVNDVGQVRGTARFEARLEPHHHLVCLSCRRIIDVQDESLEGLRVPPGAGESAGGGTAADEIGGFQVTGYQIQFVGYCGACRRRDGPDPGRPYHNTPQQHDSGGGEAHG